MSTICSKEETQEQISESYFSNTDSETNTELCSTADHSEQNPPSPPVERGEPSTAWQSRDFQLLEEFYKPHDR